MMTRHKFLYSAIIFLLMMSCTDNFESLNTDPYKVSDEQLREDFNNIGSFFPDIIRAIYHPAVGTYQQTENLTTDSWAAYLATPTDFSGGANNTTYKIVWPDRNWIWTYDDLMAPSEQVIRLAKNDEQPMFVAWAKLIRLCGAQRLTTQYGPIIYSHYGEEGSVSHYDSEEDLYEAFFRDLDSINQVFENNTDFEGFKDFDVSTYSGNVSQWLKLSNTIRLMLALRIVDVKPDLAKEEAEKAAKQSEGFFQSNNDNFIIDGGSDGNPIAMIAESWNDTRMSATMESFLVGYQDPRLGTYFEPIANKDIDRLASDHTSFPFKGIKNGAKIKDKSDRVSFSLPTKSFGESPNYTLINFADLSFMLAEAKLRGWNVGSESVEDYYEQGIRASFTEWGAQGVEDYLNDDNHTPIGYTDPVADQPGVNAFDAQTDITVKWEENASREEKLERIITQKWIGGYPNSFKAWVDFRRTGYPAIEPVYENDSNTADGIIPKGEFIKRMRFVPNEYHSNEEGVQEAINFLNGPDKISTRLWWDVDKPNF